MTEACTHIANIQPKRYAISEWQLSGRWENIGWTNDRDEAERIRGEAAADRPRIVQDTGLTSNHQ